MTRPPLLAAAAVMAISAAHADFIHDKSSTDHSDGEGKGFGPYCSSLARNASTSGMKDEIRCAIAYEQRLALAPKLVNNCSPDNYVLRRELYYASTDVRAFVSPLSPTEKADLEREAAANPDGRLAKTIARLNYYGMWGKTGVIPIICPTTSPTNN
jgi:hypothetical protein